MTGTLERRIARLEARYRPDDIDLYLSRLTMEQLEALMADSERQIAAEGVEADTA